MIKSWLSRYGVYLAAVSLLAVALWIGQMKNSIRSLTDELAVCNASNQLLESTNAANVKELDGVVDRLTACVGENRFIEQQAGDAVMDLTLDNQSRELRLKAVINELQSKPKTDCDRVVYGPDVTSMWNKVRDQGQDSGSAGSAAGAASERID